MPPRKQKQTAFADASISSNENIPSFPAPSSMVLTKTGEEEIHTPERSPAKRGAMGITEAQKQALMDNLQLEITERARKLRAQYALQAQGLRARLEMRVNRIPQALRKRNIQDLLDEHADRAKPKPAPPLAIENHRQNATAMRSSLKRTSQHFSSDNKENASDPDTTQDLANPKKRVKTVTTTFVQPSPRKRAQTAVLSPKSHNSRPVPRSSPVKTALSEKASALNQRPATAPNGATATRPASRAQSRQQTKRPGTARATALTKEDRDSEISTTSAGTTVVTKTGTKKAAPAGKAPTTTTKAPAASTAKRTTAVKKEPVPPAPAATGRTLRKRA